MAQVDGNKSHDNYRGLVRTESYLNQGGCFDYVCFDWALLTERDSVL